MRQRSLGWITRRHGARGDTWYIGYCVDELRNGHKVRRRVREAAGPKKSDAVALLERRRREITDKKWQHPATPLTFEDLLGLVKDDWRDNGRKSSLTTPSGRDQSNIKHLRAGFGVQSMGDITKVQLIAYSTRRQEEEGAAISTVRNELNVLKHGMNLAVDAGLLSTRPPFPKLTPKNKRTGFFERHELEEIVTELPNWVRPIVTFMYWTGWRRGEVLSREWRHVDFSAGVIRLDPGETKNGEGRDFPFTLVPELKTVLETQRAFTDAVERKKGQIVMSVFHHDGQPIKGFRTAWRAACKRVALAARAATEGKTTKQIWKGMTREDRRAFRGIGKIPHDFRRTAVRNLIRAGVSQSVAMELTGHKTLSVFHRYNITDDRDRRDAVAKLAAAARDRQVLPLRKGAMARRHPQGSPAEQLGPRRGRRRVRRSSHPPRQLH